VEQGRVDMAAVQNYTPRWMVQYYPHTVARAIEKKFSAGEFAKAPAGFAKKNGWVVRRGTRRKKPRNRADVARWGFGCAKRPVQPRSPTLREAAGIRADYLRRRGRW